MAGSGANRRVYVVGGDSAILRVMARDTPTAYKRVYAVVRRIPCGRVTTYGRVAELAGLPDAARQVGYALHRGPGDLPWHRVINAAGRISLPADSTSALTQRRRLEMEGVVFAGGRVDLARFGWAGEEPAE